MQVTTQTGETVTLVMPFVFAVSNVIDGNGNTWIKAIGHNQWWFIERFTPGEKPQLSVRAANPDLIAILNAQAVAGVMPPAERADS